MANSWAAHRDRLAVALDVERIEEAISLASVLKSRVGWFKIGLGLFSAEGPRAIAAIAGMGQVFLDLKLHDIPATVEMACRCVSGLGVGLLTLHASGGREMMLRAREAVGGSGTRLLGVTVLTSLGDREIQEEMGIKRCARDQVLFLAEKALQAGLDGLVASPMDAKPLREAFGDSFLLVTPGIRLRGDPHHDQKRLATPGEAILSGSDVLVVGRSITMAEDPVSVASEILDEISVAVEGGLRS